MQICLKIKGNEIEQVSRIANTIRCRAKKQWAFYANFVAFDTKVNTYLVGYFRPIIDLTIMYFLLIMGSMVAYFFFKVTWPLYVDIFLVLLIYINNGNWPQILAKRMLKKEGIKGEISIINEKESYIFLVDYLAEKNKRKE